MNNAQLQLRPSFVYVFQQSKKLSIILEYFFLCLAVVLLYILFLAHFRFVEGDQFCLSQVIEEDLHLQRTMNESFVEPKMIKIFVSRPYNPSNNHTAIKLFTSIVDDTQMFVFAKERGYFYLSRETRKEHNMHQHIITIPHNHTCITLFESPYWRRFLFFAMGYDTIMLNQFFHYGDRNGFMYTLREDQLYHVMDLDTHFIAAWIVVIMLDMGLQKMVQFLMQQTFSHIGGMIINTQRLLMMQEGREVVIALLMQQFGNILVLVPFHFGITAVVNQFIEEATISTTICALYWVMLTFHTFFAKSQKTRKYFLNLARYVMILFFMYLVCYPVQGFTFLASFANMCLILFLMLHFWNVHEFNNFLAVMQRMD